MSLVNLKNYMIQTINKTIDDNRNLNELSQLLQIDNISKFLVHQSDR